MIASARALLALIMLAALYIFTLTLVALYLYFVDSVLLHPAGVPLQVMIMLVGTAPLLWMLVRAVTVRMAVGPRRDSVLVRSEQAPQLWDAVRELAERVGTRVPAEIRLVAEANASVTEDVRLLGLLPGHKRMYIGAPLLVGMPAEELRAVLCHELGHYAHKHARFGVPAYRGSAALAAALEDMGRKLSVNRFAVYGSLVCVAVAGYAALYDRLTFAVRRRQELEADAEAAAITGRAVTAEALRSAYVLPAAWNIFLHEYVEPTRNATGFVPRERFRAFQAMLDDPGVRNMLIDMRRYPPESPRSPRDSHPSLATRLARLERCPVPAAERHSGSATELLDATDPLLRDLYEIMPTCRAARNLPWKEWLCLLAECRATMPLERLRRAVDTVYGTHRDDGIPALTPEEIPALTPEEALSLLEAGKSTERLRRAVDTVYGRLRDDGIPALTLEEVLNLLETGKSTELATALQSYVPQAEITEQDPHRHLADVMYALIGHALVRTGAAQWLLCWTGPSQLVPHNTTPEKIYDCVATAVRRPAQVTWLRLQLAALRIDVTMPVPVLPAKSRIDARSTATVDPID
jgi:Zn-dependent protease with chaperone function